MRQAGDSVEIAELAVRHRDARGGRLRHGRAGGRLPADPPPRRVPAHRPRELPLHDPRRRGVRAAVDLGGAPVVRRRAPGPRRPDRGRHHRPARRPRQLGRLAAYVRDTRVPLEMCPTSNVHTGAVRSIEEHPIDLLRRLRFRVTVNTDNRLMSGITLTDEFAALSRTVRDRPRRHGVADPERDEVRVLAVRRAAPDHQRADQAGLRPAAGLAAAAIAPTALPTELRRVRREVADGREPSRGGQPRRGWRRGGSPARRSADASGARTSGSNGPRRGGPRTCLTEAMNGWRSMRRRRPRAGLAVPAGASRTGPTSSGRPRPGARPCRPPRRREAGTMSGSEPMSTGRPELRGTGRHVRHRRLVTFSPPGCRAVARSAR